MPSAVLRIRGSVSRTATSSNPPEPLVDVHLPVLWIDPVDVDPVRPCSSTLPGFDDGVMTIGCQSRDNSVSEDVERFGKDREGFNDQSESPLGKLEDNGDGF
jgi:hypothetical protein